jgi:hypothetical protein
MWISTLSLNIPQYHYCIWLYNIPLNTLMNVFNKYYCVPTESRTILEYHNLFYAVIYCFVNYVDLIYYKTENNIHVCNSFRLSVFKKHFLKVEKESKEYFYLYSDMYTHTHTIALQQYCMEYLRMYILLCVTSI